MKKVIFLHPFQLRIDDEVFWDGRYRKITALKGTYVVNRGLVVNVLMDGLWYTMDINYFVKVNRNG